MNVAVLEKKASRYILPISIMLFIGSFFMPFVIVNLIQKAMYHSSTHWFFKTPTSASITFGVGMMLIALALFMYGKTSWKFKKWLSLFLILISIPFFMFGISNYYYLDKEGIHSDVLKSYNSVETYRWDEITEVNEVYKKEMNNTHIESYQFKTKDNRVFDLPHDKNFLPFRAGLMKMLLENKVTITDNYDEL
ncbi:hypothetical protein [Bacillus sp. FJAT-27445]|uniref:hypothetical protein n=1 Tax=Bacillus sp. FJAT-27445 TaxID=1679166 RepID=UPI000743FCBB|nr:hypothetical protein [Bacillus sp. FJAT-27445]